MVFFGRNFVRPTFLDFVSVTIFNDWGFVLKHEFYRMSDKFIEQPGFMQSINQFDLLPGILIRYFGITFPLDIAINLLFKILFFKGLR